MNLLKKSQRNLSSEYEAEEVEVVQAAVPHTAWAKEEVRLLMNLIVKEGNFRWSASTDYEFWQRASQVMRENRKERTGYFTN